MPEYPSEGEADVVDENDDDAETLPLFDELGDPDVDGESKLDCVELIDTEDEPETDVEPVDVFVPLCEPELDGDPVPRPETL